MAVRFKRHHQSVDYLVMALAALMENKTQTAFNCIRQAARCPDAVLAMVELDKANEAAFNVEDENSFLDDMPELTGVDRDDYDTGLDAELSHLLMASIDDQMEDDLSSEDEFVEADDDEDFEEGYTGDDSEFEGLGDEYDDGADTLSQIDSLLSDDSVSREEEMASLRRARNRRALLSRLGR